MVGTFEGVNFGKMVRKASEIALTIASKRFSRTVDYNEDARSSSTNKSLTGSLPNLLADSLDESKSDDDDDDNEHSLYGYTST